MTFLAPEVFLAALAVAAGVVALHFIVTRQPRAGVLPTARFIPNLPATATATAKRPSDLLLMILRVLLVLAVGAALARPVLKPSRGAAARVILVDVSRASRGALGLRDSVKNVYRDQDALVLFDSASRIIVAGAGDSISTLSASSREGNISGALIAAMRAASGIRDRADSLELVIVSTFASEEIDAATDSVRRLWPGKARLVRVVSSADSIARSVVPLELRATVGDPLQVSVSLARPISKAGALIVRDPPSAIDLQMVSAEGRVLVEWLAAGRPRGTLPRAKVDTIGGVIADTALVIAPFERKWKFASDSLRVAHVIARWVDGEPAAIEWTSGEGCIRSVAIPVIAAGDLVIRSDFVRFVAAITGDCSGRTFEPMTPAAIATLTGTGGMASREAFRPRTDVRSTLAPWLLGLAIALALAELLVRRRSSSSAMIGLRPVRAGAPS
ncbi:MAG: BatA domain-containing protein [Gemmatimonadales bacterium]